MKRNFLLHARSGSVIITEADAIKSAKDQESAGVKPKYKWAHDNDTNTGWLVWSTFEDGAGVVYKKQDGGYYVMTGWQGDFCYC